MPPFLDRIDTAALIAAADREARDRDALDQIITGAVEAHLADLIAHGRLLPSDDLGARKIRFIRSWNAVAAGTADDWQRRELVSELVSVATMIPIFCEPEQTLALLTRLFDEGTSPTSADGIFRCIEATDSLTGERGEIRLNGFAPSFWVMDHKAGGGYRRAEHMEPLSPVCATFTAPSGELLFTDTLRVGAFNDAIDFEPEREYGILSLNSATGRQARILAHAEEHNFGFVQTTNTCVAVFQSEATGALLVTERWNEDLQIDEKGDYAEEITLEGWKRLGGFSCDVWRVTAIDREVASGLIESGNPAAGKDALATYLASQECYADNIVAVPVAPGSRWRMTGGEGFNSAIDRAALGLPEGLEVWALYEPVS